MDGLDKQGLVGYRFLFQGYIKIGRCDKILIKTDSLATLPQILISSTKPVLSVVEGNTKSTKLFKEIS